MSPKQPAGTESGLQENNNRLFQLRDLLHFAFDVDDDGLASFRTSVSVSASDIQIGAVEIKDADSNERAKVDTSASDGEDNSSNKLQVTSWLKAFNGATWDRVRSGFTSITETLSGWLNMIPYAIYNASPTVRTDGQGGPLEAADNGSLKTRSDAYDSSAQSDRMYNISPLYAFNRPLLQVDVTNETNGTNNRRIDVSNLSQVIVQFTNVAGNDTITFTMELSAKDEGTVIGSADYEDISQYGVSILTASATAANYTGDAMFLIDVKAAKFLNLKTISTGGNNDGDYSLYVRGAY